MEKLSEKARELLKFLREDYKDSRYMYSGSWPYETLKLRGFQEEAIHELWEAGLIQRRDCDDYAFELSVKERGNLIAEQSLASVWYERYGDALLLEIQQEVRNASGIVAGTDTGTVAVDTVKNHGDAENPDRVEVYCSVAVGQVVTMEYDLPRKLQRAGYYQWEASEGKAIGQFMVTYVCHNMLFSPGKNMIEVQSLCEEFNKIHPRERTMMVFEEDLLTRVRSAEVVFTHESSFAPSGFAGSSHELCEEGKERISVYSPSPAEATFSPLSVEDLVAHATVEATSLDTDRCENVKILSFVDEVGYTQFSVDSTWYEAQEDKDNVAALFERASFDEEESGFRDLTGKYLEPEM